MTLGPLFEPLPPAQQHSPTSLAAADAIRPKATKLRAKVLALLLNNPDGLTDEEGISALGMAANTYRPRRCELVERGLVVDSGRQRRTVSGRRAVIWTVRP